MARVVVGGSLPFSFTYVGWGDGWSIATMITLVYEKFGRVDEALAWAERVATLDNPVEGGNMSAPARLRGLCIKGRCLAAKGQAAEAEVALTSAAEQLGSIGLRLSEVLALRDLLCCVLKKTGRESEGMTRLKASIVRLLGVDAAQEELDVLATSLGEEVDLQAVLRHA